MVNEFFYRGRDDCLGKRPANPGAGTTQEHSDYMNGYNSVQQNDSQQQTVVRGLELFLKTISNEGRDVLLSEAERFCMTSFNALYSLNPERAISYAGKFNSIQLKKMGPEDIAKFPGKLIIPIKTSSDKKESWGNLNNLEEVSQIFTYGLLNKIAEEEYSSTITRPDEIYLKFIQALVIGNRSDLARYNASAFNETQKALVSHKKRKVKQIVEIGSKFKYGISLEQTE